MHKLLFLSVALSVLIFFSACEKSDLKESEGKGTRLVSSIYRTDDSLFYTTYVYDDRDRLVTVLDSAAHDYKRDILIHYNNKNQIDTVKWVTRWKDQVIQPIASFLFSYNNNKITKKTSLSNSVGPNKLLNSYSYDANGRLIADTMYDYWSNNIMGVTTFIYDSYDNVIKIDKQGSSANTSYYYDAEMIYDQKLNPFGNNSLLIYFLKDHPEHLSKNNLIQRRGQNGAFDYKYEYYSNGLPRSYTWKTDGVDPMDVEETFFYE